MRKNDFMLLGLLLLLAGAGYLFNYFGTTSNNKLLIIQHNDQIVQRITLKSEKVEKKLTIPTEHGDVVVQYDKDGAQVIASPCPDKICIRQGKITKPGDAIACLPEKVLVALTTPGKEQERTMPSSANFSTKDLTQLSVLLAAAIALRLIETALSYLLPIPGAHLGLANCLTIIVLYLFGTYKAAIFLAARIILVGLLFTGLLTPGFMIGLSGALLSFIGMALAVHSQGFSPVGVGFLGAFLHNCGQVFMAMYLMHSAALLNYLPVLIMLGIPTGFFTGLLAKIFMERFKQIL